MFRYTPRLIALTLLTAIAVSASTDAPSSVPASDLVNTHTLTRSGSSTQQTSIDVRDILILNYHDFGPQAAAWPLLGMEWHQWESHGDSDPARRYDVEVVVYRDVDVRVVRKLYPVSQRESKDYRYVSFQKALRYLDDTIRENLVADVTRTLIDTRNRLLRHFHASSRRSSPKRVP
ncbi:MAG TPA: hypothetical protein PKO06_08500 [Candidatus Ozemobacteraceae bacterium]|nr:hypothetical protein [Candidatus Ozemobacteraceae bacterium]